MPFQVDVAWLNPLRWPREVAASYERSECDLSEGVWIGREGTVIFTLGAGFDVCHWAVAIDGWIYEIGSDGPGLSNGLSRLPSTQTRGTGSHMVVFTEERYDGERSDQLRWTRLNGDPAVKRSREQIVRQAHAGFDGFDYDMSLNNCQDFVIYMIAYALGLDQSRESYTRVMLMCAHTFGYVFTP